VEIDVAAPAVVGGQVEDDGHAVDCLLRGAWRGQVGSNELDAASLDMPPDVVEAAATDVVDHTDPRATQEGRVHQLRADERRPPGDQPPLAFPVHLPVLLRVCHVFSSATGPMTRASIFVLRKQSSASAGRWTMGSLSLNDVLRRTGTPVSFSKALKSCQ